MAQVGDTPLHTAQAAGDYVDENKAVIEALLAAKADVNAKNEVRGGKVAWRARGVRREGSVLLLWFSVLTLMLLKDPILEPLPQPSAREPKSPVRKPRPPNPQLVHPEFFDPYSSTSHSKRKP